MIEFAIILFCNNRVLLYDILLKSTFRTEHLLGVRVKYKHRSRCPDEFMYVFMCVLYAVYIYINTHLTGGRNFYSISFNINTSIDVWLKERLYQKICYVEPIEETGL